MCYLSFLVRNKIDKNIIKRYFYNCELEKIINNDLNIHRDCFREYCLSDFKRKNKENCYKIEWSLAICTYSDIASCRNSEIPYEPVNPIQSLATNL